MLLGIACPLVVGLLAYGTLTVDVVDGVKEDPFKKVEGFLRKEPRGCVKEACKIEFYMAKIQSKLKAEDKSHLFRHKDKKLIALLNDLLSVEKTIKFGVCTPASWKKVKELGMAVDQKSLDKLSILLNHFALTYRERCISTRFDSHAERHNRMEKRLQETLEPFLNRLIFARVCGYSKQTGRINECNLDSSKAVIKLLSSIDGFEDLDEPVFIDELGLMVVGLRYEGQLREALMARHISLPPIRNEFEHLLTENIVKPCKKFLELMEPIYSDAAQRFNLEEMDSEEEKGSRFFLGQAHYKLCKQAVEHPNKMLRVVFSGH